MRTSLLALTLFAAACGVSPDDNTNGADDTAAAGPVVHNIGAAQLDVVRLDIDLDQVVARFLQPAPELPLERVYLTSNGQAAENLADGIFSCFSARDDGMVNSGPFIVTGDDGAVLDGDVDHCLPCGHALICGGAHEELGRGQEPPLDPTANELAADDDGVTDPPDDGVTDTGSGGTTGDSGSSGTGSSGSSGTGSSSGGGTGGTGGNHGGAGNPGGGD